MPEFLVSSTTGRDERFYAKAIVSTRNFKYKKNIFKKMLKYVRMEVPKNAETRCRNSVITKLNIDSPIPTSFSHVTACSMVCHTVCHVLYQAMLEMASIPIVFMVLVINCNCRYLCRS